MRYLPPWSRTFGGIHIGLGVVFLMQVANLLIYRNSFLPKAQSTDQFRLGIIPWMRLLRSHNSGHIKTVRRACREYTMGAQTCVYEGLLCIDTSGLGPEPPADKLDNPTWWNPARGKLFFIDDTKKDGAMVPHDNWCNLRGRSAEPWYYGSRHWPIMKNTVAPQQSCVEAYYRTSQSLFGSAGENNRTLMRRIKWAPDMWYIDHDYPGLPHNNDMVSCQNT